MAIISFINLKGGVGKTTCCVWIAQYLAGEHNRKVLVVDLDPQTNATTALVGAKRWGEAERAGRTIRQMFLDEYLPAERRVFKFHEAVLTGASSVEQARGNMHLLASSYHLVGKASLVEQIHAASGYRLQPFAVLARHLLDTVRPGFDDILIDCAPSLDVIPMNGLFLSDAYVIPTYAEILSGQGIYQIVERVGSMRDVFGRDVPALGILINRGDTNATHTSQRLYLEALRADRRLPGLFDAQVPQRVSIAQAMEFEKRARTLLDKHADEHGRADASAHQAWITVTKEFIDRCSTLTRS